MTLPSLCTVTGERRRSHFERIRQLRKNPNPLVLWKDSSHARFLFPHLWAREIPPHVTLQEYDATCEGEKRKKRNRSCCSERVPSSVSPASLPPPAGLLSPSNWLSTKSIIMDWALILDLRWTTLMRADLKLLLRTAKSEYRRGWWRSLDILSLISLVWRERGTPARCTTTLQKCLPPALGCVSLLHRVKYPSHY